MSFTHVEIRCIKILFWSITTFADQRDKEKWRFSVATKI